MHEADRRRAAVLAIESHGRGLLGRGRARSERELRLELESDATDFASMMANVQRAKEELARARGQAAATWVQSHARALGRTRAGALASERRETSGWRRRALVR